MSVNISKAHVSKMQDRVNQLQKRVQSFKADAEKMTEKFVRTMEVGGAAFAVGVLQGKTGGIEVMGVPLELGGGLALNLLGYFGAAGKHSDHLNNLGDGALAGYLTTMGKGVGTTWAQKSAAGGAAQAQVTASKGGALAPGEVQAIVQEAVRQAAAAG